MFEAVAGYIIWGAAAAAYIAMLALTERSAAHYVANGSSAPARTSVVIVTAGAPAPTPVAARQVVTSPQRSQRSSHRVPEAA